MRMLVMSQMKTDLSLLVPNYCIIEPLLVTRWISKVRGQCVWWLDWPTRWACRCDKSSYCSIGSSLPGTRRTSAKWPYAMAASSAHVAECWTAGGNFHYQAVARRRQQLWSPSGKRFNSFFRILPPLIRLSPEWRLHRKRKRLTYGDNLSCAS